MTESEADWSTLWRERLQAKRAERLDERAQARLARRVEAVKNGFFDRYTLEERERFIARQALQGTRADLELVGFEADTFGPGQASFAAEVCGSREGFELVYVFADVPRRNGTRRRFGVWVWVHPSGVKAGTRWATRKLRRIVRARGGL